MGVSLSIKDVPEVLAERLRRRAARNHRSLQGELMAIIELAASEESDMQVRSQRFEPEQKAREGKSIEEIAAEHRQRFPTPITVGPLAVDIIRADRDSR